VPARASLLIPRDPNQREDTETDPKTRGVALLSARESREWSTFPRETLPSAENLESIESIENLESIKSIENQESIENIIESIKSIENPDNLDNIDNLESKENLVNTTLRIVFEIVRGKRDPELPSSPFTFPNRSQHKALPSQSLKRRD
jgi:hypothetical protein